jgi:replication factor C large subunit
MLINKYKPKTLKEIIGQEKPLEELKKYVLNNKPVLIQGNVGIGKTTSIHALANDLDYEILEINAGDLRNKEQIQNIVVNNIKQASLFKKNKLVLLDEIDGINKEDRGGLTELLKELEDSNYPIILTANDISDSKFSLLRKKCKLIKFNDLNYLTITKILREIIKKENLRLNEEFLKKIAINSKGDARAAINDLNLVLQDNIIDLDEREKEDNIINILKTIFKTKNIELLKKVFENSKEDLDEILLWIDENLAKEYSKNDLAKAYYYLSKADIFRKRIIKQQYWRFLYQQNLLMGFGVSLSKNNINNNFLNYTRTQRILKIWTYNQKNAKRNETIKKIFPKLHLSKNKLLKELPYLKLIFKNNDLSEKFNLKKEELDYLI